MSGEGCCVPIVFHCPERKFPPPRKRFGQHEQFIFSFCHVPCVEEDGSDVKEDSLNCFADAEWKVEDIFFVRSWQRNLTKGRMKILSSAEKI